jgi:hypothetical protein
MDSRCDKCGINFDHYSSFYTDICDPCAEIVTGKMVAVLQSEDAKYDDVSKNS